MVCETSPKSKKVYPFTLWHKFLLAPSLALLGLVVLLGGFRTAQAGPSCSSFITVLNTNDVGAHSLRQALIDICPGGVINFDAALDNSSIVVASQLEIDRDLTIDGPGAELLAVRATLTRVIEIASGTQVTIEGLTIADGYITSGNGAGINNAGTFTLTNSIVRDNRNDAGAQQGGGIYNSGTLLVSNSTITNNVTSWDTNGGGLANDGNATIINSRVISNFGDGNGGGIVNGGMLGLPSNYHMSIIDSEIEGNEIASDFGAGIYNLGFLTITRSSISYNRGSDSSMTIGGGIYSSVIAGKISISESVIEGNYLPYNSNGAGISVANTPLSLEKSFVANNVATGSGVSIFAINSDVSIENTTFYSNVSTLDSGTTVFVSIGKLNAVNNSFIHNYGALNTTATNIWTTSPFVTVTNNLFVTSPLAPDNTVNCLVIIGTMKGNVGSDPSCNAETQATIGLPVGEPGYYGGNVPTVPILPGNFAFDHPETENCPATDARGVTRPQMNGCDAGAFESRGWNLAIAGGDNQATKVNSQFAEPLTVAISSAYSEPVEGGMLGFIDFLASPPDRASITPPFQMGHISGGQVVITPTANSNTGAYTIAAGYHISSPFAIFNLENFKPATQVNLESSPNPSTFGETIIFTATVSELIPTSISADTIGAQGESWPFEGTVAFYVNGEYYEEQYVGIDSTAWLYEWHWDAGEYTVTAVYSGNVNYAGSTSNVVTQVINKDDTNIELVGSENNPSEIETGVTFTVTVSAALNVKALGDDIGVEAKYNFVTGTVNLYDGATLLDSKDIDEDGMAVFTTYWLPAGDRAITASYVGNKNYNGSTTSVYTQTVYKHSTETVLEAAPLAVTVGDVYYLTATVTSPFQQTGIGVMEPSNPLEGYVAYYTNGEYDFDSWVNYAGQAWEWMYANQPAGIYTYTGTYTGNDAYAVSSSNVVTVEIVKAASDVALESSLNPSNVGNAVTFTATVTTDVIQKGSIDTQAPKFMPLTGDVVFKAGGQTLGTVTMDEEGVATLTTSALTPGSHNVTAEYVGNDYLNGNTSPVVIQVVNDGPVAVNDAAGTLEGQGVTIAVLENDLAGTNNTLSIQSVTQPSHGSAVIDGNAIVYTPNAGFSGLDSFGYVVVDGNGLSDSSTVALVVSSQSASGQAPQLLVIDNAIENTTTFTGNQADIDLVVPSGVYTGSLTEKDVFYLVLTWLITPTVDSDGNLQFANVNFDLSAYLNGNKLEGFVFDSPVTMTINYGEATLGSLTPESVQLLFLDGDTWSNGGIELVSHNTAERSFVVRISHLSEFALFGTAPTNLEEVEQPNQPLGNKLFMPDLGK